MLRLESNTIGSMNVQCSTDGYVAATGSGPKMGSRSS